MFAALGFGEGVFGRDEFATEGFGEGESDQHVERSGSARLIKRMAGADRPADGVKDRVDPLFPR